MKNSLKEDVALVTAITAIVVWVPFASLVYNDFIAVKDAISFLVVQGLGWFWFGIYMLTFNLKSVSARNMILLAIASTPFIPLLYLTFKNPDWE